MLLQAAKALEGRFASPTPTKKPPTTAAAATAAAVGALGKRTTPSSSSFSHRVRKLKLKMGGRGKEDRGGGATESAAATADAAAVAAAAAALSAADGGADGGALIAQDFVTPGKRLRSAATVA